MRIGITGAFSSGKTTLAQDLYDKLGRNNVIVLDTNSERFVADKLNFNFRTSTEREIRKYQNYLYEYVFNSHRNLNESGLSFITDNPLHTMLGYTNDEGLINLINENKDKLYDIIILAEPVELEDDGIRHNDEEFRKEVYNKIVEGLMDTVQKYGDKITVRRVVGNRQERLEQALNIIKQYKKYIELKKRIDNF